MGSKCKECAFFAGPNKDKVYSCFVEPGKRYIVWPDRPRCRCYRSKESVEREEEILRLTKKLGV